MVGPMSIPDLTVTEVVVTLSPSGPRWVSEDSEFAVWSAVLGEERDAEPLTLTGPLGHVTAGEQLLCVGGDAPHARHGWQFVVASLPAGLPQAAAGGGVWVARGGAGV